MTVRQIIKQGQDTLARFPRRRDTVDMTITIISDDVARRYRWEITKPPIQYPQSLGELCMSLAQEAFMAGKMGSKTATFTFHMSWMPGQDRGITQEEWEKNIRDKAHCYITTGDIRALRVAMYHRRNA